MSHWRRIWRIAVVLLIITAAGAAGFHISQTLAYQQQLARSQVQLRVFGQTIASELARYDYVPHVLTLDSKINQLLDNPDQAAVVQAANLYLSALNERTATRAIYILDKTGKVLATSNWQRPDSYLGEDLSYRPYFRAAIQGQTGRFYGVGTTRSEPGYYLSAPLGNRRSPSGVAVVKVGLEPLEANWQGLDGGVLLVDENGVVILASQPRWRLQTVFPLAPAKRAALDRSLQYNRAPLPSMGIEQQKAIADDAELVRIRKGSLLLSQNMPLAGTAWRLYLLSSTQALQMGALKTATLASGGSALLALLGVVWNARRRINAERQKARIALEAANAELERKVIERTADLSAANLQLQAEVTERIRTEATLRRAQDELLQAGKLAVIGQMSTGIAHELNQPLAALRTLSGNTVRFLARGDLATAQSNLQTIIQLVERMGKISGALKSFARKSSNRMVPVELNAALENALFLLETRIHSAGVVIERDMPAQAWVKAEATRLEQVLVNLLANALDAVATVTNPHIRVVGQLEQGEVSVSICDNGPGLTAEAEARLFEPFFTTKPVGEGLGLGLTLSIGILDEFGGRLSGYHQPQGGACFTMVLPQTTKEMLG
ncbi:two-component system C4-dicarboxylate transport sensor histidine kinase DctB [Chitinivorax tropicus]|uniref:C4-dicarboxylate transport sensor protein DctB n=1 Tax=Chitinivorax tropicus TaxID=714531 RepID=A0A840MS05_9PROT|nr:ATP-binding protein [Chitinivorax tropicus]MBB5019043.1 two-component system C4-dicarboxylate transport sensor histidine kinase DctB [Chitinivorax tropicus]